MGEFIKVACVFTVGVACGVYHKEVREWVKEKTGVDLFKKEESKPQESGRG